MMNRIFTRQLKKNFYAVRLLSKPPEIEGPLICFINHPSWNDPMVISFLSSYFFPRRESYGPIEQKAIEGYRFFTKIGLYGVSHDNPGSVRKFLRTSLAIIERPNTVIWITAQGKFADARERPVTFEPGMGVVLRKAKTSVTALPVAVEYTYGEEKYPEIFVTFGQPVENSDGDWTNACERAMESAQDELAKHVIAKDTDKFETILGGSVGVGGIYGLWLRLKAVLQGRKYDPSHGSLTS
jgi:hypothetical protein